MSHELVKIIEKEFEKKQLINKRYSLRSFAKYLDLSPATLSKILSKKASITPKILKIIGPKINLSPQDYYKFELLVQKQKKESNIKNTELKNVRELQMDEFNFISDWFHYAILEIFNLDHYNEDPKWIAKKLGINDEKKVVEALNRLIHLNLLKKNEKGQIVLCDSFNSILDYSFSSVAMRERQKQIMRLSCEKIDSIAIEKRDHSSIVISVDEKLLPEIKVKIKDFRRSLGNYIVKNSKKRNAIYELHVGFIPLTELD
jgi:uncharacterized protein (TIGR02147 family)